MKPVKRKPARGAGRTSAGIMVMGWKVDNDTLEGWPVSLQGKTMNNMAIYTVVTFRYFRRHEKHIVNYLTGTRVF